MPELVPLDFENFKKSLGPGYRMSYFKFENMTKDRGDDCFAPSHLIIRNEERRTSLVSNPGSSLAEFLTKLERGTNQNGTEGYHSEGHNAVAECGGPMAFSEAAARDPTFWRWHKHVSDFIETTLDTRIFPAG